MPTFIGIGDEKLWLCPTLDDSPNDLSGGNHNGTYINQAATAASLGAGGTLAYQFDGTDDMLDVDNPPDLDSDSRATISMWCKASSVVNWMSPGGYVTSAFDDYRLTWRKTNSALLQGYARYSNNRRGTSYWSYTNTLTEWNHYLVLADSGSVYFYVNGAQVGSATGGTGNLDLGSTFTLGSQDQRSSGSFWNGYIDDVRVFARAIETEEITHLSSARGVLESAYPDATQIQRTLLGVG